ncbi:hypothetical protein IFM89_019126 [Coptis chinensis]|uniref:LysM domain receptor-like kinase 3 n=1 Tax=Coptis chinensis TaxID=261450 RepID=A0A835HWV1_9MAGN|nr:hypothetical protein IFM89_019126 [Coptis chinensis]
MAPINLFLFISLLATIFSRTVSDTHIKPTVIYPLPCTEKETTCNSYLYHISEGLTTEQIASYYSVSTSQLKAIYHKTKPDYLISVPCTCKEVDGTVGYFYDTSYKVLSGDTFVNITTKIYSGQAWTAGEENFLAGENHTIHLVCGCVERNSQVVVTYTVQDHDTLSGIASLLSAKLEGIERLNTKLTENPGYIDVGWVLLVPKEINGLQLSKGRRKKWPMIIGILSSATLISIGTLLILLLKRKRARELSEEDPKAVSKTISSRRTNSLQSQYCNEDITTFETERPAIFTLDDVEEATANFHESRKIGEGGYGSVYFGVLGEQKVAVKKMKSNKSKEFFAELKVLCKIHHINVVELQGYASGDDHLYLVYEYVQNGALSDHLHDPLLKGHQPLSWTARAQIALDAARGIEYIHDHTKAHYVHRDIKTSNILLDEGLRAKVADFGLVKLVERTNEDDFMATRLVGTPGYLPPESVRELQTSSKTDVFAFGVVLAELITGQRALIRDKHEPSKMKSLISVVYTIFQDDEPEQALEAIIDGNIRDGYPTEEVYKNRPQRKFYHKACCSCKFTMLKTMAEIAEWCLSEDAVNRPEMREIVVTLSQILMSSVEWEASLGGNSQVFSGVFNGR